MIISSLSRIKHAVLYFCLCLPIFKLNKRERTQEHIIILFSANVRFVNSKLAVTALWTESSCDGSPQQKIKKEEKHEEDNANPIRLYHLYQFKCYFCQFCMTIKLKFEFMIQVLRLQRCNKLALRRINLVELSEALLISWRTLRWVQRYYRQIWSKKLLLKENLNDIL